MTFLHILYFFCIFSMYGPISFRSDSTRAELCKKRSSGSTEYCPSFDVSSSTFYTLVHAYKSHRTGNLKFTGDNLISVTNTTDETPSDSNQCQQIGLYADISILKKSIMVANEQTKGESKVFIQCIRLKFSNIP